MSEAAPAAAIPTGLLPPGAEATGGLGRLLTAALLLFSTRGYHGVSVRDIASSMGVQPSSLYAHYRSKEALFSDLVLLANSEIRDRLRRAIEVAPPDPAAQLRSLVEEYVSFHAEYPLLATLGHNDLHVISGDALHRVTAMRKEGVDLFHQVIDRGNAVGQFACGHPLLAVAAIAGMGIRLASWYRPPGREAASSAESYSIEVREWMPGFTVEEVRDSFAGYALALVGRVDDEGRSPQKQL